MRITTVVLIACLEPSSETYFNFFFLPHKLWNRLQNYSHRMADQLPWNLKVWHLLQLLRRHPLLSVERSREKNGAGSLSMAGHRHPRQQMRNLSIFPVCILAARKNICTRKAPQATWPLTSEISILLMLMLSTVRLFKQGKALWTSCCQKGANVLRTLSHKKAFQMLYSGSLSPTSYHFRWSMTGLSKTCSMLQTMHHLSHL